MFARLFCTLFALLTLSHISAQTYDKVQTGQVMHDWYLAGPLKISKDSSKPLPADQERFFNRKESDAINVAFIPSINQPPDLKQWKKVHAKTDIIDLDSIFNKTDYASAFAYAIIQSDKEQKVLFGIGSDDGVKVWHNGKLVHKNWIPRGIVPDNDIIPLTLVKGKNEILLEVQDIEGGWGFTARFVDAKGLSARLVKAAGSGDLDETRRLMGLGADFNTRSENGQTPLDAARISGRDEIVKLLLESGAKDVEVPPADKLLHDLYDQLNEKSKPGIAVLVAKDGKTLFEKGYGYANIANKTKITSQTKFRIGSITKQFIAAAILKLQEEGKISTRDSLTKYFPGFPQGGQVSIHHLLTHTSGIHSFTNKPDFLADVVKPITNEKLLDYFKNDPYDFKPGEKYQYNNSGYFLLGLIIEKITGVPYGNYLKKQFFDPLGMTNTGIHSPRVQLTNEALGYEKADTTFNRALNWNMDWAGGAGSMYSTVLDLHKWNEALFGNKVLKAESMKAAFTPVVLNSGEAPPGTQYGYGWGLFDYRGMSSIAHSGGLHGFISQLLRVPNENMSVVLLTNVMPPQVEIDPMKVAELYLWKKMAKQATFVEAAEPEKDLDKYTGRYDFSSGMVMLITKENDGLYAQMSGQSKHRIFQSAPAQYFWKAVEAKIHFVTDSAGNVTHGLFEQGSIKVNAPKMKDVVLGKADTTLFASYEGLYKYTENTNIRISSKDGTLYGEATGDQKYELLPLSDTEFHIRELNAYFTFKKDTSGKVNAIRIKFAGNDKEAIRIKE